MASQEVPQFCIILRGPAATGKSTLAQEIQERCTSKTAWIDTDLFNWTIVPGEDDKAVVYENVVMLAENYLRRGYNVIIEGLIISSEERGMLAKVRGAARECQAVVGDFYCSVPKDEALRRNKARAKAVSAREIAKWWDLAEADRENISVAVLELNLTLSQATVAAQVLEAVTSS